MTVISKIAGSAGLISSITDIHKTAMIYAKQAYENTQGDCLIKTSIGGQKANRLSYRDANRKNWLTQNNFFAAAYENWAGTKGYLRGLGEGILNHVPELSFSTMAVAFKNGKLATLSAIALGITTVYDFIMNSTSLFDRTDYLKRK